MPLTTGSFARRFLRLGSIALRMMILVMLGAVQPASAGLVVTRTSAPDFYIDSSISPAPTSEYVSYQIVNNGTTNIPDMWVTITNFTGGKVSLGAGDPGQIHLGSLAVGQTNAAFFYLTSTSGNSSTAQGHTIKVFNGYPTWGALLTNSTFSLASVQETINASANKVNTVVSGPTPAGLGGVVTITVDADTGTLGNPNIMALSPACWSDWRPDAYAMFACNVTLTLGNTGTFTNQLYIPPASLPSSATTHYVASYYFRAVSVTTAPTDVSPIGYITSGANVKHTDTTSFGSITPLTAPTNQVILTNLLVSTNLLYGGTVTYTVQFSNLGTNASQLDEIVNSLPSSFTYVAGSSTFNGAAISDPNSSSSVLTWSGLFSIPAGTTKSLTFRATVPNVPGTYTNSVIGLIGNVQIDTTLTTTDNFPATITVAVPTNSVPSFTKGADQTVLEDSGANSVSNWATSISPGAPAIDTAQTVNFIVSNNNSNLFSVQPSISASGTLTYTTATNANGSATVTVQIHDNGGTQAGGVDTSASQTFVIALTPVNDVPSFVKGANQTVLEDAGAQTVSNWATSLSTGPTNEVSQTLSFTATNNNNSLFSVQPAIDSSGNLTYTPVANANGVATVTVSISDNGGTSNGGVDTSATQTFTITVTAVNDAPTLTAISNQTVLEDSGSHVINMAGITNGPNESGQTMTFTSVTSSDTGLIPNPTVSYTSPNATGTLTYTPVANSNGVVTITVVLHDNGGTANGGSDTITNTFTITVTPVNDVPTLNAISNLTINEDASQQTVNLAGISAGLPPNESGQSLTVTATSSDTGLIPNPTVNYTSPNATGTLNFTPVPNSNGVVTITVVVQDSGGTSNGGVDAKTNTFTVTVTAINDPPTLNAISNATVNEDAGIQTVNLAGITPGPLPSESAQTVTIVATSSNTGLIPNPTISYTNPNSTGTLSYTPTANSNGVVTITVVTTDNGGTANGGINSTTNTFTVTVNSANDPPTLTAIANRTINEDAAQQTVNLAGITAGPPNENSQSLTITATSSDPGLIPNPTVNYTSPGATGTLNFTPVANSNGIVTITVIVQDSGGTTNGGIDAVTNTFTVTVNSVNDAPTLDAISNQTVLEDAGQQSVNLSGITVGPTPNESWQTVSIVATSGNTGIIPNPTVSYTNPNTTGVLNYTPTGNSNGVVTITVVTTDSGGTTNGGVNATTNTFTITVTAVNDAPTITSISNRTINEDASQQTVNLTGITAGPPNETGQTITVTATSSDPGLIPNPTVNYTSPNGTGSLTFTPVANSNGVVTITVVVQDNGGTANGGISAVTNTFTVTVNAVNDVPGFVKGTDIAVNENVGAQTFAGWATSISAGPLNEASQSVDFIVNNDNSSLFSVQPTISPGGTLTFTPSGNATGTATVTVRIHDDGGTANSGTDTSAAQTFEIRINVALLTTATGGEAISADKVGGAFTSLTAPVYSEGGSGDAGVGTIILSAPAGYEFDTGGTAPTVLVTRTGGSGSDSFNINGVASGTSLPITSISSSQITFTVTSGSTNGVADSLAWQNIRVRPTNGNLPTGNITSSGTSVLNQVVSNVSSWGTLGEIPGAATQLVFHTEPSPTASAGVAFAQQPVIWIEDQFGNRVTADNSTVVTLSRDASSGTAALQGTLTGTAINGVVAFSGINYRVAETILLDATSSGLVPAVSTSVTVSAAGAAKLAILTQPSSSADAGVAFLQQPVVAVEDQFGNIILTDNTSVITASRDANTGTGTLYGTAGIQVVNGIATFTNLSYQVAETIWIDFNSGSFQAVISDDVTIIAGPPSKLAFAQQPTVETAGIIFSVPTIVRVTDAYGNFPTDLPASLNVTLSLPSDQGVLSGNKVIDIGTAAGNGFVTYTNLQINMAGENKILTATASGLTDANSDPIVIVSTIQPYSSTSPIAAGAGPIGVFLANLRALNFSGSDHTGGARWRDMIVANYNNNTVMVRLCRDDGSFAPPTYYPVGPHPFGIRSGDFNRDGYEDIVVTDFGTNKVSVLMNRRNATFAPAVSYTVGSTPDPGPIDITMANVMGDGGHDENSPWPRPDLITANYNENSVSILHALGNGTFAAPINYAVGSHPTCVAVRDMNKDGLIDILTANSGDGTVSILYAINRTNGTFHAATNITVFPGGDPQPIYLGTEDFNGDGLLDIATVNYNSNSISIFLGQSDGTFQHFTNYTTGTHPRSFLIRDMNRDGKPDIAVANNGSATVDIFLNVGDGSFISGGILPVGSAPMMIWGSNFNNDQATDFIVSNFGDDTISVLLYNGPLAYGGDFFTLEDAPVAVNLGGGILDGTAIDFSLLTDPAHGTLSGTVPHLTYTPDQNFYGVDSFQFRVFNSVLSSSSATIRITVRPVNDAPVFTLATNQIVVQAFGALTNVTNFARNIVSGPANESMQTLTFITTLTAGSSGFYSTQPRISTNGTLTFKPALGATGTNYVTVRLKDNGKTASAGRDLSDPQIFAIVVPNPFPVLKRGSYNGLFYEAESVSHYRSGFFTFQLTDLGNFTGRLLIGGKTYSLSSQFNVSGVSTPIQILRTGDTTLVLNLILDVSTGSDQVVGTIGDGVWTANLLGDRAVYTGTLLAPQAGRHTLSIPGSTSPATSPQGDGYGILSVSRAGLITMSGQLADGTVVSQTVPLSKHGEWPLYLSLYGGKGSALGWITFTNSLLTGDLSWIKTPVAGRFYPTGFTNGSSALGSLYVPPQIGTRILGLTNGLVVMSGGNMSDSLTNEITLATNNIVTVDPVATNKLSLTFATNYGSFSGKFFNPTTRKTNTVSGVVLQLQNEARGYFLGTNQSGRISLTPQQ